MFISASVNPLLNRVLLFSLEFSITLKSLNFEILKILIMKLSSIGLFRAYIKTTCFSAGEIYSKSRFKNFLYKPSTLPRF